VSRHADGRFPSSLGSPRADTSSTGLRMAAPDRATRRSGRSTLSPGEHATGASPHTPHRWLPGTAAIVLRSAQIVVRIRLGHHWHRWTGSRLRLQQGQTVGEPGDAPAPPWGRHRQEAQ
jgi:hypothetical protein